jgi:hypothetical protein
MTNDDSDDFAGTGPIPEFKESPVKDTALFRRNAVVACLVLAPLLLLISSALQPPFVADYVERLAGIDEAGGAAWASNVLFTVAQVPMLVAFLGIAHVLRARSPRLANIGGGLGVVATFGEAVMGGTGLVYLTMASDSTNRELFARVWEEVESSPVMMFAVAGFGLTVVTQLLLSVGLFRSRVVPRWVPALVWAFLVLEFFVSNLSEYASYAGSLCLLVAFVAVARTVAASPREAWSPVLPWPDAMGAPAGAETRTVAPVETR